MNLILFGSFIIGIILTVYGSVTLPIEIPGYNGTYTGSYQSSSEQLQKHKNDLMNYQIQSKEFIIIIVGVSIIFLDILYILCYNYYNDIKEETKKRRTIKITPYKQNINKNVIESNKIEKQSITIVNSNKISAVNSNKISTVNSNEIPIINPRQVKITLPNVNSRNIKLPVIYKLQDYSKLYFHQMPPNYQKYFIENDKKFNRGIDYQYIK
jgi:hypothetical protein